MILDPRTIRRTVVTAANPVTKLGAALLIGAALLVTIDAVSAITALVLELLVLPWCGVPARALARVLLPITVSAALAGLVTVLIGVDSGEVLAGWGPFTVTSGSAELGLAIGLRVLAVALPSVVLMLSTDPTDLADALGQRLHLPARFVLGALAALRLVGVMINQWQALTLARRARGLGDATGVFGGLRVMAGQAFSLLVLSVRRGTRLAMAMEARGFGSSAPRTWARPSRFSWRDAVLLGGATLIAVAATLAAVWAGTWSLVVR